MRRERSWKAALCAAGTILVTGMLATAGVPQDNVQPDLIEQRVSVALPIGTAPRSVVARGDLLFELKRGSIPWEATCEYHADEDAGAISFVGWPGKGPLLWLSRERPGDKLLIFFADATVVFARGDGSEVRFAGSVDLGEAKVTVEPGTRLCFRRCGDQWVYLCGRGRIEYTQSGRVVELGERRTAVSCLALMSSSDAILREGGARDAGRVTTDADVPRVLPKLHALLADVSPTVRQGAAEALGLIGGPQCLELLKTAAKTEWNQQVLRFIAEAIALCMGKTLIGEPSAPRLDVAEAARAYVEGRTEWVDDVLAQRMNLRYEATTGSLMGLLDSADPSQRLAAVRLLAAVRCREARPVLVRMSTTETDESVKAAAREALEKPQ